MIAVYVLFFAIPHVYKVFKSYYSSECPQRKTGAGKRSKMKMMIISSSTGETEQYKFYPVC